MKKIFTILLFIVLAGFTVNAQLPDGSIAPNFTATDLDGNTWELYDLLDQGKTVIIDLSATWCGPCWNYHESGALEQLYELYGPDGTDEVRVFMIEGDPSTNVDCIYNLPGCNSSTYGDWTEGTPYPIINDDFIAEMYALTYWPTIYHICPSRILTEIPQLATEEIYLMNDNCPVAVGDNNAAISAYDGFSGIFCSAKTFSPVVTIQNLGTLNLTSLTIEFYRNGVLEFSNDWAGDLATYGLEDIIMDELTIGEDTEFEIRIINVNGVADADTSNNSYFGQANFSTSITDSNFLTLELMTDGYPGETYWEISDESGVIIYKGGNQYVKDGSSSDNAYTETNYAYLFEIALPKDDCYEFSIYDSYGDGICCAEGNGYYRLKDSNGIILLEGGDFESIESTPFSLENAGVINDNAAIVYYSGEEGSFCGDFVYNPFFTVQNIGANLISSIKIEASNTNGVLTNFDWSGVIPSGEFGTIQIGELTVSENYPVTFRIVSINGNPDELDYQNSIVANFSKNITKHNFMTLIMELDDYAYEIYWQMTNGAGDVIASGGNQTVGPNGGGARVATEDDPGAYGAKAFILEDIVLPEGVDDCIDFLLVDDYGDGLVDGGGGYFSIENGDGEIVVAMDLTPVYFADINTLIDAQLNTSGLDKLNGVEAIELFPNPVTDELNIQFILIENQLLQLGVYDLLGKKQLMLEESQLMNGKNQLSLDVSVLKNGLYYLRIENEEKQITRKFTVLH
jgi:thiol-disulfide isomerase/thioredoxin